MRYIPNDLKVKKQLPSHQKALLWIAQLCQEQKLQALISTQSAQMSSATGQPVVEEDKETRRDQVSLSWCIAASLVPHRQNVFC